MKNLKRQQYCQNFGSRLLPKYPFGIGVMRPIWVMATRDWESNNEEKYPLNHYNEPLDNILNSDPSDDSFNLLVDISDQVAIEGIQMLEIADPQASKNQRKHQNIDDFQTFRKLYERK
ncbi:hypothetical protein CDAR_585951 [Caerostris darwini]|uniref:Uncharacterized protein n=1 Tax=Caerostris darwini TaxID=1538125 RepID=A0AAV4TLU4_9ARAC|nr:hypothetical protein CDAR_585951 [Caerostris darwini]